MKCNWQEVLVGEMEKMPASLDCWTIWVFSPQTLTFFHLSSKKTKNVIELKLSALGKEALEIGKCSSSRLLQHLGLSKQTQVTRLGNAWKNPSGEQKLKNSSGPI